MDPIYRLDPTLVTPAEHDELRVEARAMWADREHRDRPGWQVVDGWQFLGPARFSYAVDGAQRLAVGERLAERIGPVIGLPMTPVQSNYLYYGTGDFLGLHHDQRRCPYTVIALLDGDAEPLCLHPELVGAEPEKLARLLEPGGHSGGDRLPLADGPLLLAGTRLPHHRDPHPGGTITIVTWCFAPGQGA